MAKFYMMGNYTAQGFQGFLKDPKTDRSKAAQTAADAVGAKMLSYTGLRGAYDFCVVAEGTFEQAAAIKMATVRKKRNLRSYKSCNRRSSWSCFQSYIY